MSKGVGVHPARCWRQVRSSRRGERPARLGQDRVKVDRAEVPDVDTYVDLTGQRLQTAMAVAVQVECAAVLAVPSTQGIMAENEAAALELELGVVLNAGPAGEGSDRRWIVVAGDQVLGAVQARQESGSASRGACGPRNRPDARPCRPVPPWRSSAPPAPRPWRRLTGMVGGTGPARRHGRNGYRR